MQTCVWRAVICRRQFQQRGCPGYHNRRRLAGDGSVIQSNKFDLLRVLILVAARENTLRRNRGGGAVSGVGTGVGLEP
jgi:hypothetical protein